MREKRNERNMTLDDVARIVHVSRQTIQKYETGIIDNIPSDKIEHISEALGCSPEFLMGWSNSKDSTMEDYPTHIRSAARDMMKLSDENQKLAISMIRSLAAKGGKAKED